MKIGLLWPDYWPYIRRGTERMVHDIAHYVARQGHTVDVLASKPGRGTVEREGRITIYRLPQIDHPMLRFYTHRVGRLSHRFDFHGLMVLPILLRERYDLIHTFFYVYGPSLSITRRLRRTPTVYHVVMIPPYWPRRFDRRLVRSCIQSGAPVRVFSRFCAQRIAEDYDVESHVVPPSVDLEQFRPNGRKELSRPKILYTADLVQPPKGPHVLALAFNRVHQACREARLQLAGPVGFNPPGVKQLLQLIQPEARGSVEVIGPGALEQLPNLYAEAAVTVLPSIDEPFGMVLTESLASGTPVVGTRSGAIPEIIVDPQAGTLFERTDDLEESARNLAAAILQTLELAKHPGTVDRCRRLARQWTWDAIGSDFDRLQALAL